VRLAQKARGTGGGVIDALADAGSGHLNHGADQRARRVVLATVAPGVAHVADLRLVQVGELVLLLLRAEAQSVDQLQGIAQAVAAGELVADLAEDLADLVFDGVRPGGALAKALQVGEQLAVDEGDQVGAGQRRVMVELAIGGLRCRPGRPAVGLIDKVPVGLAHQLGLLGTLVFQIVQVLEKQHPRGLLGVVQLRGAAGFLPEHVIDVAEGLFEHSVSSVV